MVCVHCQSTSISYTMLLRVVCLCFKNLFESKHCLILSKYLCNLLIKTEHDLFCWYKVKEHRIYLSLLLYSRLLKNERAGSHLESIRYLQRMICTDECVKFRKCSWFFPHPHTFVATYSFSRFRCDTISRRQWLLEKLKNNSAKCALVMIWLWKVLKSIAVDTNETCLLFTFYTLASL